MRWRSSVAAAATLFFVRAGSAQALLCPRFADVEQTMIWIPGGTFQVGDASSTINPLRRVTIPDVCADMVEVSIRRYNACASVGRCSPLGAACSFSAPNYPATCLTAADAEAVCAFEGKRLPSQEEWERAARGPSNAVRPPAIANDSIQLGPHAVGSRFEDMSENPYAILDIAGNASEWTSSIINQLRVVRGGSFVWTMPNLPKAARALSATERRKDIGVRCFVSAQSAARNGA